MKTEVLENLANKATEEVAKVLSEWAHKKVKISQSKANVTNIDDLSSIISNYKVPIISYSSLESGKIKGISLMLLDTQNAYTLIDLLMQRKKGITKKIGKEEESAIKETSNLLSGSYLNILVKNTNEDLKSSKPYFIDNQKVDEIKKNFEKIQEGEKTGLMFESNFNIIDDNINVELLLFFTKEIVDKIK